MAFSNLQKNASFDLDFCPLLINATCKLTEVCCPNKTACCPDEFLTQNIIVLFTIIGVLVIIDLLVGYKVYQRWKNNEEAKERAKMSIKEVKTMKNLVKVNNVGDICLKQVKVNI